MRFFGPPLDRVALDLRITFFFQQEMSFDSSKTTQYILNQFEHIFLSSGNLYVGSTACREWTELLALTCVNMFCKYKRVNCKEEGKRVCSYITSGPNCWQQKRQLAIIMKVFQSASGASGHGRRDGSPVLTIIIYTVCDFYVCLVT